MGVKLSKAKISLLKCGWKMYPEPEYLYSSSPLSTLRPEARHLWDTHIRNNSRALEIMDIFVDKYFFECLIHENKTRIEGKSSQATVDQQRDISLVFVNCFLKLENGAAALTEFLSHHRLRGLELWDGELPVDPRTLDTLFRVVATKASSFFQRLRLDNVNLISIEATTALNTLVCNCQRLSHIEMLGCNLNLDTVEQLAQGVQNHDGLKQVILTSCLLDSFLLAALLQGLGTCLNLTHLHITGNHLLESSSLPALTSFLRVSPNLEELYIPRNPHLFQNCRKDQALPFFKALLKHGSQSRELILADTGVDATAASYLFQALYEHQHESHAIERLDLRYNACLEASLSWCSYLPHLKSLRSLYLPSSVEWHNAEFRDSLQRNTSLFACPRDTITTTPFCNCFRQKAGIRHILSRNKLLQFVKERVLAKPDISQQLWPMMFQQIARHDPTALFYVVRDKLSAGRVA